jgi:uncharacterized protein YdeI (YjbR/CyaY-like superfamily)
MESNMNEKSRSSTQRDRSAILADIATIGLSIRGSITQKRRKLADGTERIYHQLQYWSEGKNHTIHIPDDLVDKFMAAVAERDILDGLVEELSDRDTQAVLSRREGKKKQQK